MAGVDNMVMGAGTSVPVWSGNVELNNETGVGFHFRGLTVQFDIGPGTGSPVHPTYQSLLKLDMSGNVGIGTTNPQYKLHVDGDIYSTGQYLGSDLRLKRNVTDLSYGLGEILRLRPVSYEWRDRSDGRQNLGLIGQEVEGVIPEIVARGKDEAGMMSLNYTGLVPVLIKAIHEQQAAIGEQQAAMQRKDAEIAVLNAAIDARLVALEQMMEGLTKNESRGQK